MRPPQGFRLHKARVLLVADGLSAKEAAHLMGYASAFSDRVGDRTSQGV